MDMFKEIKKQRTNNNDDDVTIDGAAEDDIPEKFEEVYKSLYNRSSDEEKVENIKNQINNNLGSQNLHEIDKINSVVMKDAIGKIKANKSDPIYDISSDFLKNTPNILFEHLAQVIKAFITHGHVTQSLLIATLVPLVKDTLANIC